MDNIITNVFLAGWCADAVGARLEFTKHKYDETTVIEAMHFIGENIVGVYPGQFTDDSEMEIALLNGLLLGKDSDYFPIEEIATEYIEWYNSNPFDIGLTTRNALLDSKNAEDMVNNAYEYNEDSESNGSLMRCIPIAVFCIGKPYETILDVAESDASLTHYNPIVKLTTGIYCCIISKLLLFHTNHVSMNANDIILLINDVKRLTNNTKIVEWIKIGLNMNNLNNYDSIKNEGHVKHAFIFVIYFLNNIEKYSYETAIIEVLKCGGDTDTNAKIVGNLFGAYYSNCVPNYMKEIVLNFDCTQVENDWFKRPEKYGIRNALKLVEQIIYYLRRTG